MGIAISERESSLTWEGFINMITLEQRSDVKEGANHVESRVRASAKGPSAGTFFGCPRF